MDNGFMWYFIGLSIGIVIGMPSGSDIVTKMNADFRAAARTGAVTPETNCQALIDLQGKLNDQYQRRADDGAAPSRFSLTMDDCLKAARAPQP